MSPVQGAGRGWVPEGSGAAEPLYKEERHARTHGWEGSRCPWWGGLGS